MSDFSFFDSPVGWGADTAAAAYDGTVGTSVGTAATANSVIYKRCSGVCGLKIRAFGFQTTVAFSGAGAALLTVFVRPTFASDTNRRVVGTITVPASSVIGDVAEAVFSTDFININPGEEITCEVTTKTAALGSGFISALYTAFLVGPTSGGTATVPIITPKPFQTNKVGSIKLVSSGQEQQ